MSKSERDKYLHTVGLVCSYLGHRGGASPQKTVQAGYDKIVDQYASWTSEFQREERERYVKALTKVLPKGSDLLDLGCGTGLPSTKELATHFHVTGVDISKEAIARASRNIASGRFIQKDMTEMDFPPETFDVVTAFYSLFHVPRRQQPSVIEKIGWLLRPGGIIVATMGSRSVRALFEYDWMGTQMYWSSFDGRKNLECFQKAVFRILSAREVKEKVFENLNTFLWVTAQKPASADKCKETIASDLVRLLEDLD